MTSVFNGRFSLARPSTVAPIKTKIVCTIGPNTQSVEMIGRLAEAGMNVVRMNFSHGTHEFHGATVKSVRDYTTQTKRILALLLDTKGPEIRTCKLKRPEGYDPKAAYEILLEKGKKVCMLNSIAVPGTAECLGCTYENLPRTVKQGDSILLDDGLIELLVEEVVGDKVMCVVRNSGKLGETKGVNLPNNKVDLPAITKQDEADIMFGVEQGVDFIAASFVRKASDVLHIRELLDSQRRGKHIKIIAKIESAEGIENFEEILAVADGIMVARGDLGVEIPIEKVGMAQKWMISRCNSLGKPVITATQMLESMMEKPRPTRAEATDVGNAVFDGTDCVMLSGETAKGLYPIEAVTVMASVCREAEAAIDYHRLYAMLRESARVELGNIVEAVASSAVKTAHDLGASLIVTLTETGNTARLVAKYRPAVPVLCITSNAATARQSVAIRNLLPITVGSMIGGDALVGKALFTAKEKSMCHEGDMVVVVFGLRDGVPGFTNSLKVVRVQ